MNVIYVFESSDDVAAMEAALIGCYRRFDRSGKHVGNPGHHLCCNRAPGGENAHVGHSPFFVYVVFQMIAKSQGKKDNKQTSRRADGGALDVFVATGH